ncbi:DnaB-like replicative helicase [Marinitoga phage MPV1]|uniref:Replicative DNA helicase n=1 Tax=Marinitoga piezophila (strain DSM 14283 / JCM 11233 / KA3) TaxID=443254 RepID=H2J428_MARPK|nr:replicative DNA helicase [Marinitoga piezophila]AEX84756.1 replicative DNA helicase [Marinitoga piezophila KA3]
MKDLEKWIIGYMFLDDSIDVSVLTKDDFENTNFGVVFEYLKNKLENGEVIDVFTASADLKLSPETLEDFIDSVPDLFNFENAIKKLKEESIKRQLKHVAENISKTLDNANVYEILEYVEKRVLGIEVIGERIYETLKETLETYFDEVEEMQKRRLNNEFVGIPSGINDLDKFLGGFKGGQLIIIAGRPAMGKTTFALNIATNMARKGYPSAFFSLEMNQKQLRNKILASATHIEYNKIAHGFINGNERTIIKDIINQLKRVPIVLGKTTNLTIDSLKSVARKLKREYKIQGLFVDYLQLMTKTTDLVKELGIITRQLKLLALELDIPIFLLSQLSRNVEHREDKRPMLSDLRDSGTIEQDADIVMFLYRPAYYARKKVKEKDEHENKAERIEVIIGKQREGETGIVELGFFGKYSHFFDLALAR